MSNSQSTTSLFHTGSRGVKRKRGKTLPVDPGAKIRGKLHHGLKTIHKVAKKEKTFEIQRLVKKKKSGGVKPQDTVGYDEQLAILKALDPDDAANLAMKTKIGKDKFLSRNEHVKAAVESELSSGVLVLSEPGTVARIVESRFLSSKRIAAEIQSVLQGIKDEITGASGSKAPKTTATQANQEASGPTVRQQSTSRSVGSGDEEGEDEESDGSEGEEEGEEEGAGWESGTVADGEAEDGWDSGSVDDAANDGGHMGGKRQLASDENDSDSEASDASDASSQPATKRKKQPELKPSTAQAAAKDPKGKTKASAAESTFLPSLSVGFVRGDSDASDWSDAEANAADGVRKNRRGQRARRAIWEKKYGRNANHVKKAQEGANRDGQQPFNRGTSRANGGPRRDGFGPDARPHRSGGPPASRTPGNGKSPRDTEPTASRPPAARSKPKEDKPLHPSWEAKKRLKEKQNPIILPAQGKKITFD